jgi:hopene-associated glycosyltransferase HpnB
MLTLLAFFIWLYLFFAHGEFWKSRPELPPATPRELPDVDIVIPARDEADTIAPVVASLLAQDYAGTFRIVLVDDNSSDGTAATAGSAPNLLVISGQPKPSGWSGKLWALNQGSAASTAPVLLFADADVVHDPRHLSALVARLLEPRAEMVSEMVRLNCTSVAERILVPAFVYFFQMLYPFAKVNDPRSAVAAAAGGTVLIRREALNRMGGIAAIKNAIYLGHSGLATSIRRYPGFADLWQMIARSAFTQLRYSPLLLVLTIAGLVLIWLVPVWALLFGQGWRQVLGLAAFVVAAMSYMPTLARYRQNRTLALALPLIALFYMAATLGSAINYWFGRGAHWKNRAYGAGQ